MLRTAALIALLSLARASGADEMPAKSLPTVRFVTSVEADNLYDQLRADPLFAHLSKDVAGSPIELRVTHSISATYSGQKNGEATSLLALTTLGLVPVVTNYDLAVTYEILVNGTVVSTHFYGTNVSKVKNLWSKDRTHGLGDNGLAWVKSTAREFLMSAHGDPGIAELLSEYEYYFGAAIQ